MMVTRTLPCRVFIFWGGGASSGHETVSTKYVPSKGPFLPNSLLTFLFLKIMMILLLTCLPMNDSQPFHVFLRCAPYCVLAPPVFPAFHNDL